MTTDNNQQGTLTHEDYSKAMNMIGQNLLSSLVQTVGQLPQPLRHKKVVSQGLSAFLMNVIYKQFPNDKEACLQMLQEMTENVQKQLDSISSAG